MSGFSDFTLGSSAPILSSGKSRWKPEKGKYRVTFVALPNLENGKPVFEDEDGNPTNPSFKGGRRLYKQGVGYFLDHGPEYQKIAGGPSKTTVATTLIFWPTSPNGVLDKTRFGNGDFEIKTWVFSVDKYRQLESINAEFPLSQHDLNITVTDAQFHKMSFAPCKDSLFKALSEKNKDFYNTVISVAKAVHANVQNDIAQDMTLDQIREKLSGEVGSPVGNSFGGGGGSTIDVDDVLDDVLG
jgi:hypothetical protein